MSITFAIGAQPASEPGDVATEHAHTRNVQHTSSRTAPAAAGDPDRRPLDPHPAHTDTTPATAYLRPPRAVTASHLRPHLVRP
jgi:hypothetical protein